MVGPEPRVVRDERRQGLQPAAHDIEGLAQDEAEHDDRRQKEDAAKDRRSRRNARSAS